MLIGFLHHHYPGSVHEVGFVEIDSRVLFFYYLGLFCWCNFLVWFRILWKERCKRLKNSIWSSQVMISSRRNELNLIRIWLLNFIVPEIGAFSSLRPKKFKDLDFFLVFFFLYYRLILLLFLMLLFWCKNYFCASYGSRLTGSLSNACTILQRRNIVRKQCLLYCLMHVSLFVECLREL